MSETPRTDALHVHAGDLDESEPVVLVENVADMERELSAALARAEVAESALIRNGYRKSCEISACNCGDQWNHGGHARERLSEISAALRDSPIEMNGKTLLSGVMELAERTEKAEAERDAALATVARYETLRPASEHDGETMVLWHGRVYSGEIRPQAPLRPLQIATWAFLHGGTHWTPLPDVKEAMK